MLILVADPMHVFADLIMQFSSFAIMGISIPFLFCLQHMRFTSHRIFRGHFLFVKKKVDFSLEKNVLVQSIFVYILFENIIRVCLLFACVCSDCLCLLIVYL